MWIHTLYVEGDSFVLFCDVKWVDGYGIYIRPPR